MPASPVSTAHRKVFEAMKIRGVLLILLACLSLGCGGVESDCCSISAPGHTSFVWATPGEGEITPNTTITVDFDWLPSDLTVSAGSVTVDGKKATITGPFPVGPLTLTLTWADGTHVLNYTVKDAD